MTSGTGRVSGRAGGMARETHKGGRSSLWASCSRRFNSLPLGTYLASQQVINFLSLHFMKQVFKELALVALSSVSDLEAWELGRLGGLACNERLAGRTLLTRQLYCFQLRGESRPCNFHAMII